MNLKNFSTKQKVIGLASLTGLVLGAIWLKSRSGKVKLLKSVTSFKNSTVGTINVIEVARQLGMDLGTAYNFYDPRHWTENDSAVRDTLLQIPHSLMTQVSIEYAKLYKSNLQQDVQRLLPASDYQKVRSLFL